MSSIRPQKKKQEYTWRLFDDVTKFDLVNREIIKCVSCGRCVGNCPATLVTGTYNIRDIIRRVLDGDTTILTDPTIWDCFMCGNCIVKCPKKGLRPPEIIQNLREYAINKRAGGLDVIRYLIPHVENFLNYGRVIEKDPASERAIIQVNKIADKLGMKTILAQRKKVVEEAEDDEE